MGRSLGLAAYLAFSARADALGERILARRLAAGKEDPGRLGERRGAAGLPRPEGRLVWFHAASVGEVLSLLELIRRLGEARRDVHVLVTTGTQSSARMLAARMPPRTRHQFLPLDTAGAVRRFLAHWRPDLAVWTESELWPRLIVETHAAGIPMLLINARMSRRSHDGWRWVPGFAASLLGRFTHVLAQDAETGRHLRRLGLPRDRLEVTGSLKEGSSALPCNEAERAAQALRLAGRPLWLAASTHEGEEAAAVLAHAAALKSAHRLLLVIVPRHPERGPAIAETLTAQGWAVGLRSRDEEPEAEMQIYIADTLGELGLWYRLAPLAFVGGSLVEIGGHNPFEPAALGSAILYGPHVANFRDIFTRLEQAGAAQLVRDAAGLGQAVTQCLAPDRAARMAHAAWEVCSAGAEVTERALALLLEHLPAREAAR